MRRRPRDEIVGLPKINEDAVYPHVFENHDREVGGVLVGRQPKDGGLPLVTGAIPALQADEQRATLTFTQAAWEHVHHVLDTEYGEDEQIVGWYHSHPGFGIFLSEHDLFIHRNFFSGPSQIALVVDPLAGVDGVFVWRDGEVDKLYERPTPNWPGLSPRHAVASVPPPGAAAGGPTAGGRAIQADEPRIHRGLLLGAGGLACFLAGAVVAVAGPWAGEKTETDKKANTGIETTTVTKPARTVTKTTTTTVTTDKGAATQESEADDTSTSSEKTTGAPKPGTSATTTTGP